MTMPRTRENLTRHEWIGLQARVDRALDPTLAGLSGRVVDETQHTVTLERADGREVQAPKAGTRLLVTLPGGMDVPLDLGELAFRPQDRVKRARASRGKPQGPAPTTGSNRT
jgi:ribonuclease P protein subunit POP4